MENNSKKIICALSSAAVLCSTTVLPANAAIPVLNDRDIVEHDFDRPYFKPEIPRIPGKFDFDKYQPYAPDYAHLKNDYFILIMNGRFKSYAILEVEIPLTVLKHDYEIRYQWYYGTDPIIGADSSTYAASKPGYYYCYVWFSHKNVFQLNGRVPKCAARSETATVIGAYRYEREDNKVNAGEMKDIFAQKAERVS